MEDILTAIRAIVEFKGIEVELTYFIYEDKETALINSNNFNLTCYENKETMKYIFYWKGKIVDIKIITQIHNYFFDSIGGP